MECTGGNFSVSVRKVLQICDTFKSRRMRFTEDYKMFHELSSKIVLDAEQMRLVKEMKTVVVNVNDNTTSLRSSKKTIDVNLVIERLKKM